MPLTLRTDYNDTIPLEVEGITPDVTCGKAITEIERLTIHHGNRKTALSDFFHVSGTPSDAEIRWEGDLSSVHWIGSGMTDGSMRVQGPAGRHIGSRMQGGRIEVFGNVSDWVGAELLGGVIHVHGNAGHLAGAAYRGSAIGMAGGTLLIDGSAGNEVGHSMRRGFIAVGGDIGDVTGMNMRAGSVFSFGNAGIRFGAGMRRGTIALLGDVDSPPLPTFRRACCCKLQMLRLIERSLQRHQFPHSTPLDMLQVNLYNGDLLEGGRGELLLKATA